MALSVVPNGKIQYSTSYYLANSSYSSHYQAGLADHVLLPFEEEHEIAVADPQMHYISNAEMRN